jgi:hypothetical protein
MRLEGNSFGNKVNSSFRQTKVEGKYSKSLSLHSLVYKEKVELRYGLMMKSETLG